MNSVPEFWNFSEYYRVRFQYPSGISVQLIIKLDGQNKSSAFCLEETISNESNFKS